MKKQFNRLLRWLLFRWVRVEVFPQPDPAVALDPKRPLIYLLADRGLSDLLVLQEMSETQHMPDPLARLPFAELQRYHSVYSIASRSPVTDWVHRRRKQSPMLADLAQAFADNPDLDLQIVPVSVFWGRPLARNKHWLQVLFADTWAIAGRTRRFFTLLIHGRNTRLIFSPTLDLRELLESQRLSRGAPAGKTGFAAAPATRSDFWAPGYYPPTNDRRGNRGSPGAATTRRRNGIHEPG